MPPLSSQIHLRLRRLLRPSPRLLSHAANHLCQLCGRARRHALQQLPGRSRAPGSRTKTPTFSKPQISASKNTELEFATTLGGYRLATSVGGTLTGRGGNIATILDSIKPQDAYSEALRESTKQWYANTFRPSRLDDKTEDAIVGEPCTAPPLPRLGRPPARAGRLKEPKFAGDSLRRPIPHSAQPYARAPALTWRALAPRARAPGGIGRAPAVHGVNELRHAQYQQQPVAEGGNLIRWAWFQCFVTNARTGWELSDHCELGHGDERQRSRQLFGVRGAPGPG